MWRPQTSARVENAAAFGLTQADSAEQLKVDEKTLRKHFRDELSSGKFKVDMTAGNVKKVWLLARRGSLVEFVDWSGVAFFALGKLLVNAKPVEVPAICDGVFAIVDSATKTGSENDGTGVGFRIGDKEAAKRADDLLDCFVYGVALSLGNAEGF
jgi:hypothetical protein